MLGWRTQRAIPYLPDYEAASKRETNTKAIRGRPNDKPLGLRKRSNLWIKRDEKDQIVIGYYSRVLVTYKKNGDILIASTRRQTQRATEVDILENLLRIRVQSAYSNLWVNTKPMGRRDNWLPFKQEGFSLFRYDATEKQVKPINLTPPMIHRVNRKRTNAVRRRYKLFIDYVSAMNSLMPPMTRDQVVAMIAPSKTPEERARFYSQRDIPHPTDWGFKKKHAQDLMKLIKSDQPEQHFLAWVHLAYVRQLNWGKDAQASFTRVTQDYLNRVFFRVHRDECLDLVPYEGGHIKRDEYHWVRGEHS